MLRGVRTQYLRRRLRLLSVFAFLGTNSLLFGGVLFCTGRQRIVATVCLLLLNILMLESVILTLTDKQRYKREAKVGREANQRGADAINLSGDFRPKALAFAKRFFVRPKSD